MVISALVATAILANQLGSNQNFAAPQRKLADLSAKERLLMDDDIMRAGECLQVGNAAVALTTLEKWGSFAKEDVHLATRFHDIYLIQDSRGACASYAQLIYDLEEQREGSVTFENRVRLARALAAESENVLAFPIAKISEEIEKGKFADYWVSSDFMKGGEAYIFRDSTIPFVLLNSSSPHICIPALKQALGKINLKDDPELNFLLGRFYTVANPHSAVIHMRKALNSQVPKISKEAKQRVGELEWRLSKKDGH